MFLADLHIHSRYSRATSRDCVPEHLEAWARRKGLDVIGTGDFTHPAWRDELREKLEPTGDAAFPWHIPVVRRAGIFVFQASKIPEKLPHEANQEGKRK